LVVSWFDEDDSEGEVEIESSKPVTALTGKVMSETESCDEKLSYDELSLTMNWLPEVQI